jgi:hypothetical protein
MEAQTELLCQKLKKENKALFRMVQLEQRHFQSKLFSMLLLIFLVLTPLLQFDCFLAFYF